MSWLLRMKFDCFRCFVCERWNWILLFTFQSRIFNFKYSKSFKQLSIWKYLSILFQIIGCFSCTRWLLVPWLCIYILNMILLCCVSVGMILVPVPIINNQHGAAVSQALRLLGLVPLVFAVIIFYSWLVVR